eukprot:6175177-Pleurochrysis_carterae.AAC.5
MLSPEQHLRLSRRLKDSIRERTNCASMNKANRQDRRHATSDGLPMALADFSRAGQNAARSRAESAKGTSCEKAFQILQYHWNSCSTMFLPFACIYWYPLLKTSAQGM